MAMIKCMECGKEISDRATSCPNCGCPVGFGNPATNNAQYQQNNAFQQAPPIQPQPVRAYINKPTKNSGLGIAALILSILGITFFIGIILAVIDLCRKDGNKKTFSIVSICICVFWVIMLVSVGGDDSGDKKEEIRVESQSVIQDEAADERENESEIVKNKEETKTKEKPSTSEEYIDITSTELIDAYNENQVKCKQMYDGKMITVTGKVDSVGTDIMGTTYVCLGHDTEFTFVGVQCYAKDENTINEIAELKEGDIITVSGKGECGSLSFSIKNSKIVQVTQETYKNESGEEIEDITTGQKNALSSARSYLEFSAFSYDGLIKQLEFESYSHEDAVFAVDNCGADWNEQAVKSAKSYLEMSSFSKDSLIEQLEYEGFTHEQAVYGAEQNGY
jgi:hypothetical protein